MGARANVQKIELILRSRDFNRRVGLISNYDDLEWLGLTGHCFAGSFSRKHLPDLLRFCAENPEYHIVTCDGPGRSVNRLLPDRDFYKIANGDKDPCLVLNYLLNPDLQVSWEDTISSTLAESDHIKNRSKT